MLLPIFPSGFFLLPLLLLATTAFLLARLPGRIDATSLTFLKFSLLLRTPLIELVEGLRDVEDTRLFVLTSFAVARNALSSV